MALIDELDCTIKVTLDQKLIFSLLMMMKVKKQAFFLTNTTNTDI